MKEYIGIGDAKVSISEQAYEVLSKMDRTNGLISDADLEKLQNSEGINVKLINTQRFNDEEIKIYGLTNDDRRNFEIVKVK